MLGGRVTLSKSEESKTPLDNTEEFEHRSARANAIISPIPNRKISYEDHNKKVIFNSIT